MDDLTIAIDNIKISALSKHKYITNNERKVTVDYSSSIGREPNLQITIKKNATQKSINETVNSSLPSQKKIYYEAEVQRQEEVRQAVNKRLSAIRMENAKARELNQKHRISQQKKVAERIKNEEIQLQNELNNYEQTARVEHEKTQKDLKLQEQIHAEKVHFINQNKQLQDVEKMCHIQKQFRIQYQHLVDILKQCEDKHAVNKILIENSKCLKEWPEEMDRLVQRSKTESIDAASFKIANDLIQKVAELSIMIKHKVDEINCKMKSVSSKHIEMTNQTIEKSKEIVNNIASEVVSNIQVANVPVQNTIESNTTEKKAEDSQTDDDIDYVSQTSFKTYLSLRQFRLSYETKYQNLLKDDSYKKYRFECQKAINIPINAISAVSAQHLLDKYHRLKKLLSGDLVEVGNAHVTVQKYPEGIFFCMDLLAKKFVRQGELMVASNPESAFPIAAVILFLWCDFPEFGKLILAHFHNECPYIVPMYLPQAENQSDEEYYKALGYRYTDGEVERQDKFLKRMSGIIRLYAAILVSNPRRGTSNGHPHGLNFGWRLLTCILNMNPRLDITATVLHNILDVAGSSLLKTYGKQFKKILIFLYKDYFQRLEKVDTGGPVARLQVFLQEIIKTGIILPPKGVLQFNF